MTVIIGGTGTIAGLQVGGLQAGSVNTATLAASSVTQTKIADGVTSAGPAFSAYLNGLQSVNYNTYTKIQFNTEEFDTANCFDSTTNYRFTPNVAGYYQFYGSWLMNSGTSVYAYALFYKNGSQFKNTLTENSHGVSNQISALIYMNGTTDYLEMYVNFTTANNTIYGSSNWTYFQGFLVRAA